MIRVVFGHFDPPHQPPQAVITVGERT